MKAKNCLIFGGTGQIGRNLIRKLAKNNYKVTVITRNAHTKGNFIKTQANAGYIEIIETNPFDENEIKSYFEKTDICINLVGILFEKGKKNSFDNIHCNFPMMLAKLAHQNKIQQLIHVSALGVDRALDSKYAISKLNGEKNVFRCFNKSLILRPSIVYSVDDKFSTTFMTLLNRLPIFPLYYNGNTKFTPIHCSDMTDIILNAVNKNINSKIVECVGPEILSFKEILLILLDLIGKKRFLLPFPLFVATILARIFQLMPNPLLTTDQLKLLKYDNVISKNYITNSSIGVPAKKIFKQEVEKYCYMWRAGGQFSKETILED
jgi:NADH dehydrogenase